MTHYLENKMLVQAQTSLNSACSVNLLCPDDFPQKAKLPSGSEEMMNYLYKTFKQYKNPEKDRLIEVLVRTYPSEDKYEIVEVGFDEKKEEVVVKVEVEEKKEAVEVKAVEDDGSQPTISDSFKNLSLTETKKKIRRRRRNRRKKCPYKK